MLAIVGASGKLGYATLSALLSHNLLPKDSIVCTSSSPPSSEKYTSLTKLGVQVRAATFDDPSSLERALEGCTALFLVSSPRIALDFNNAPPGSGREKDHKIAIDAARRAGVQHIYYTSLAFANPSKAGVMQAHMRTEAYLAELSDISYTVIREGLYNESWPLYFGHYNVGGDERTDVPVGGDSPISWASIADLGLANALVLAAPREEYKNKTFYLSNTRDAKTLDEVAAIVSKVKGKQIKLKVVSRQEHEKYYITERKMDPGMIRWWASTYDALRDRECLIKGDTFVRLLSQKGQTPKPMEETIQEMINSA